MKVISCNIGEVTSYQYNGREVKSGINKYPAKKGIFLGKTDVKGDSVVDRRYHGGIDQACYLYGSEQYKFWQNKYPDADWHYGIMGENITIEGLQEDNIFIDQIYQLGEATVQISKTRKPCFKIGLMLGDQQAVHDFWKAPYPGVYLRILKEGIVKSGDNMTLIEDSKGPSILEIYKGYQKKQKNSK